MMERLRFLWAALLVFGLGGCKKDALAPNSPPLTRLFVGSIALSGEDRLQSLVRMNWTGEDKDGVVKGFEYSINGGTWKATAATDTVFRFDLSPGANTTDVYFCVRAIDDKGLRDPAPACLKVPIRNTPPVAVLDSLVLPADTALCVLTYRLRTTDADGAITIDSLYVKLNDGAWTALPGPPEKFPSSVFEKVITLVPENPGQVGSGKALLYFDTDDRPYNIKLDDMRVEGNNTLYFRAKDKGGLFSDVFTGNATYLLSKKSELLVLDSWKSPMPNLDPLRPIEKYRPVLNQTFSSFDYLDLIQIKNRPALANVTFKYLWGLHKSVFWFAQQLSDQIVYIETGESVIQNYLNANGRILFSVPILPTQNPSNSVFFNFAPFDSVAYALSGGNPVGAGMDPSDSLRTDLLGGAASPYPELVFDSDVASGGLSGVCPGYVKASAEPLYHASKLKVGASPWNKNVYTVVARSRKIIDDKAQTNLIFSIVPIHRFKDLNLFLNTVKEEFNW